MKTCTWKKDLGPSIGEGFVKKDEVYELRPTPLELDVSKVLLKKYKDSVGNAELVAPADFTEDESVALAHDFLVDKDNSDYFFCRKEGDCESKRHFEKVYGAEPFVFDENNQVSAINKEVFSKWIDDLWKDELTRCRLQLSMDTGCSLINGSFKIVRD